MRILVLTLMLSFLSHSAFGADSTLFIESPSLHGFADPEPYIKKPEIKDPDINLATVHFLWVGEPARGANEWHDTMGPDLLRGHSKLQPIKFYCCEAHAPYYKRYFYQKNIQVVVIESYVKDRNKELLEFIQKLIEKSKSHTERCDKIRELVTIIDIMKYFIQIYESGFVLDTNVFPSSNYKPLTMYDRDKFAVVEISCIGEGSNPIDAWLMYSGQDELFAQDRFDYCFSNAKLEFYQRRDHRINRSMLTSGFINAAFSKSSSVFLSILKFYDARGKEGLKPESTPSILISTLVYGFETWDEKRDYSVMMRVPELALSKLYCGTHKLKLRTENGCQLTLCEKILNFNIGNKNLELMLHKAMTLETNRSLILTKILSNFTKYNSQASIAHHKDVKALHDLINE